jgi:hypothetical protein
MSESSPGYVGFWKNTLWLEKSLFDKLKPALYVRIMVTKAKFLKKLVLLLVLLGFILPIKAPVSSAKAKLCCMSKGHCMMGKASGAQISVMGSSKSAKMISCCEDNCVSCSDTSVLHSRANISSQNMGMPPTLAPFSPVVLSNSFFDTGPPNSRRPDFRLTSGIHSPPLFKLNSIFLI